MAMLRSAFVSCTLIIYALVSADGYDCPGLLCIFIDGFDCPNGWTRYDASCYMYYPAMLTWFEASTTCQEFGSFLAEIESAEENSQIVAYLKLHNEATRVWLGANDMQGEGLWVWDMSQERFEYTAWGRGQPDSTSSPMDQDCLIMWDYAWGDWVCERRENFICEKPIGFNGAPFG